MARKKLKLLFIANNTSRKATFKKRKNGLLKKVKELSTLCGITACAIIYSPYDSNPEVWPSTSSVQRIVSEFRALPEMEQQKKMLDQKSFLEEKIAKTTEHLKKEKKENREMEISEVMFQCLDEKNKNIRIKITDLNDLGYLVKQNLKNVNRRIEILESHGTEIGECSNVPEAVAPSEETGATTRAATIHEVGSSSSSLAAAEHFFNPMQHLQQQQQFLHLAPPHAGLYEQPQNQNLNQQQWFMEMMNHGEQMRYAAEQLGFPFMDENHQHRNDQSQQ